MPWQHAAPGESTGTKSHRPAMRFMGNVWSSGRQAGLWLQARHLVEHGGAAQGCGGPLGMTIASWKQTVERAADSASHQGPCAAPFKMLCGFSLRTKDLRPQ